MTIEFHDHHGNLETKITPFEELVMKVIAGEKLVVKELNIIFVTDEFLKNMHEQYLSDNTETDVITFDLSENDEIEAEIYISYDRANAHAALYDVPLNDEIARLVVHGILHLLGFYDYSDEERAVMRQKEDHFLNCYWK